MNSVRSIPIEDIGIIILDHQQITITQGVIAALLNNSAAIITCDSSRMPIGLLLSIPVLDVIIEGKRSPLMIAASQTTASLAKCFYGEIRKISYPEFP